MEKRKGMTLLEVVVIIVVITFVVWGVITFSSRFSQPRLPDSLVCRTNLKGMSNALVVYGFDYNDEYPVQKAVTHDWDSTTTGWDNPKKDWENSDGTLTVASSLYLLVREADVSPKSFICPASDQSEFVNETGHDIVELWDFGPNPTKHQSYAYQFPYGKFPAHGKNTPATNAIMADRNPWFDKTLTASSIEKENSQTFADKVALIDFEAENKWKQQVGNAAPHDREGQNVLFSDGHVEFVKRPDVGTRYDNIYTIGGDSEEQRRVGKAPAGWDIDSANAEDSLLVND